MTYAWFALVALCLVMYVVLDGYDLGIGIGTFFDRDPRSRRTGVEIVASIWDANESWLILLGVTLWAGFPEIYGTMLPHLYIPLSCMLIGLAVRGVSTEIISHSTEPRARWFHAFAVGSLVAAFSQGVAFGALTTELRVVEAGVYRGGAFDFLTPYSLLCGVAAVLLYGALGMGYLRLKAEHTIADPASRRGRWFLAGGVVTVVACAGLVVTTDARLDLDDPVRRTVFVVFAVLAGVGVLAAWWWFGRPSSDGSTDRGAYAAVVISVVGGLLAWIVARYPEVVPGAATVDEAVSPGITMVFLLVGVGINMPLVLFYNWFAHNSFRGRYVLPEQEVKS